MKQLSQNKKTMATFFVACLLGVCLTAAVVVGVTLLFSERFRRTGGTTAAVDKGGHVCRMVEISGSDVKIYYNPAPEELEDAVPFIESPGSRPLDDGESDIETAVGNKCSDEVLRQTLVSLMESGMTVVGQDGMPLSIEDIMDSRGCSERVIADGEKTPTTDSEPAQQKTRTGRKSGKFKGAMGKLDSEFKTKEEES